EMWNAYDLDMVDKLFVIDDRVTYLSSEKEGTIVGIEAVREHHRGFGFISGGVARETSLWVDQLHETVLGNTVVVTGFWYFKRADGSTQRGPMTFVYFLEDEEWRLVHVHFANYLSDARD
ncbi:MAG: hypothetical protein GY906_12750, partial [bacterium]|nr:hypothetical protein [bacterium]